MSLFSALQMGANTLQAMQIGLQVVGNNIANANTPGFVREKAIYSPAPIQEIGSLSIGLGVEVTGIVQIVDEFNEIRLRDAASDRASAEAQESAYKDLEVILGSLNDETSINAQLTNFFNAINNISLTPDTDNAAVRDLAIKTGEVLAQSINTLSSRVSSEYDDLETRVTQISDEINTLAEEIRTLNLRIVEIEAGGASNSDAGALRSQRAQALNQLSELADVTVVETPTGTTNVTLNGQILVFEATRREVQVGEEIVDGQLISHVEFRDNGSDLEVGGGELHGVYEARDNVFGAFLQGLDEFSQALTFQFNKVYSQGQGQAGFDTLTSTYRVNNPDAVLNTAGLTFTPENGKFDLKIYNTNTGKTDTHTISVDLNGLDSDTTLSTLAEAVDAVSGVSAVVSLDNELVITSESSDIQFAFEKDTSGVLAALGLNTFFTGSSASNIGVNSVLLTGDSPGSLFAASLEEIGDGTGNVLNLIALQDQGLEDLDGGTIAGVYSQLLNETTRGATLTSSVADGLRVFEGTLQSEAWSVSGVNLDEEAIDMIQLQATYQASARYIQTVSELLDLLVNL